MDVLSPRYTPGLKGSIASAYAARRQTLGEGKRRQPLGEGNAPNGRPKQSEASSKPRPRSRPNLHGRGRSCGGSHEKENEGQQQHEKIQEPDPNRRMMMELTDLRASARELKATCKKQKATINIDGRLAEQKNHALQEELRKERELRESTEEEARLLKQRLAMTQRSQASTSHSFSSLPSSSGRASSPPDFSRTTPYTQIFSPPSSVEVAPAAPQSRAGSLAGSVVVPPAEASPASQPHQTGSVLVPANGSIDVSPSTPSFQVQVGVVITPEPADGDASAGRSHRWRGADGFPTNWAAAVGAAAAAGAQAAASAEKAKAAVEKARMKKGLQEVPKLPLQHAGSAGSTASLGTTIAGSLAAQQLADDQQTPANREGLVKIIEENVSALRRELEDLSVLDNTQTRPSLGSRASGRSARRTWSSGVSSTTPRAPAVSDVAACASALSAAREALSSARDTARSTLPSRPLLSISGIHPGGTLLSPRFGGPTLSPRLDESCNSARDSVHSLMNYEAVNVRLDKANADIARMLIAGNTTLAEIPPATRPTPSGKDKQEDTPLSPASVASGHTPDTCSGGVDDGAVTTQVALMGELSRMSQLFLDREKAQEAQQPPSDELQRENKNLKDKLREAEIVQMKWQMEMHGLRQALRCARSTDTSGSSIGAAAISLEEGDRQCQTPLEELSFGPLLKSRTPRASLSTYCWPPAPPSSHVTWQRGVVRSTSAGLRRTSSVTRVKRYHKAMSAGGEERLLFHQGSMHAILPAHRVGSSSNLLLEGTNSAQSAVPSRSSSPTLRRSASVPGVTVLTTAHSFEHSTVGSHLLRARSSSLLCSDVEANASASAAPSLAWSTRSPQGGMSPPGSRPCSRSPSPPPSVCDTPMVGTRHTESVKSSRAHRLVKIRDSPPRRVSPRGSLHRSHWRLVSANRAA